MLERISSDHFEENDLDYPPFDTEAEVQQFIQKEYPGMLPEHMNAVYHLFAWNNLMVPF